MNKIANVYAEALFSIVLEEKMDKEVLSQVLAVKVALEQTPEFVKILDAPMISKEEKNSLIDSTFKQDFNKYLINFLKVLVDRKAGGLLSECLEEYENLYNEHYNIEKVTATTAIEMNEHLSTKLIEKLASITGKQIVLEKKVDPSCIGGIVLEFSDKQMNDSIKQKLNAIKAELSRM